VSKLGVAEVLRDRNAYLLFYARDDLGNGVGRRTGLIASANDTLSSPSTNKLVNGAKRMNGSSSSPGQKRLLDEEQLNGESPPKRLRVSDNEEEHRDNHKAASRQPLKTVIDGNMDPQIPTIHRTYTKPTPTITNGHTQPRLDSLSRSVNRPYSPKQIPRDVGGSKKFFREVHNLPQPTSKPLQERVGTPKHKIKALETTTFNVYANVRDPFVEGAMKGQQRKSQPRPSYPGISSAIVPGANREFERNSGMKNGMSSQRDILGVKVRRRDAMR
jgi:hypothetical protein